MTELLLYYTKWWYMVSRPEFDYQLNNLAKNRLQHHRNPYSRGRITCQDECIFSSVTKFAFFQSFLLLTDVQQVRTLLYNYPAAKNN